MKYKVQWLEEVTTKSGKKKANTTLVDVEGNEHPNVAIWADFPNFNDIRPESTVEGNLVSTEFKGKSYVSLHPAKNTNGTFAPKQGQIEKAIVAKNQNIEKFQDKKVEGIKDSSTFRDATLYMIQWSNQRLAMGVNWTTEEWNTEWILRRKWLDARFSEPFN